jgi:hypothetical protein
MRQGETSALTPAFGLGRLAPLAVGLNRLAAGSFLWNASARLNRKR